MLHFKRLTKRIAMVLIATLLLASPQNVFASDEGNQEDYDGYLIVVNEEPVSPCLEHVVDNVYWSDDASEVNRLLQEGCIEHVEPNYVVELEDGPDSAGEESKPYELLGISCAEAYTLDGKGVRIALIDSGLNLENANIDTARVVAGYDYVNETSVMSDSISHGTKIAQLLVGKGMDNAVKGIAPSSEIVPLCCFTSTGGGTVRMLAKAIRDAVDHYDCDIINMSWGIGTDSEVLYEAIRHAYDAGAILVAAAGNITSKYKAGTVVYPAGYEEVIGVGALNSDLTVADYSQQTSAVFVCAPGSSISFMGDDGTVALDSGTSYAAPCISATAAIVRQIAHEIDTQTLKRLFTERAADIGEPGPEPSSGCGMPKLDGLILNPWSWMAENDATLHGWLIHDGGGYVIGAAYCESGKMCDIHVCNDSAAVLPFSFSFSSGEDAASYSLFYLDSAVILLTYSDYVLKET